MLLARLLFRRDGPNEVTVDFPFRDAVSAMKTTRRFGVSSVAVCNSLSHAIHRSLHAKSVEHNVDQFRLDTWHSLKSQTRAWIQSVPPAVAGGCAAFWVFEPTAYPPATAGGTDCIQARCATPRLLAGQAEPLKHAASLVPGCN